MTVSSGMDHTIISMRPEYSKSGRYVARVLEARNHQAKANVAAIVGTTMASMIASESIRMVLSAIPIGPCGSRTAGWHAAKAIGAMTTAQRPARTRIDRRRREARPLSGGPCALAGVATFI